MTKLIRLWDENWNLIWSNLTSSQTIEDYLTDLAPEPVNASVELNGHRWTGKVTRTVCGLDWFGTYEPIEELATSLLEEIYSDLGMLDISAEVNKILECLYPDDLSTVYRKWRNAKA